MNLTISLADGEDLAQVRSFYQEVHYTARISSGDVIIMARTSGKIVGAARLCTEAGVLVLRGMQVAEGWQRKGVGAALLQKFDALIGDAECFCLAHDHLEKFYRSIGFEKVAVPDIPIHLQGRIAEYASLYPNLIAMRRFKGA